MPGQKRKCEECGKEIPGRWFFCDNHITKKKREEYGKNYYRGPNPPPGVPKG